MSLFLVLLFISAWRKKWIIFVVCFPTDRGLILFCFPCKSKEWKATVLYAMFLFFVSPPRPALFEWHAKQNKQISVISFRYNFRYICMLCVSRCSCSQTFQLPIFLLFLYLRKCHNNTRTIHSAWIFLCERIGYLLTFIQTSQTRTVVLHSNLAIQIC